MTLVNWDDWDDEADRAAKALAEICRPRDAASARRSAAGPRLTWREEELCQRTARCRIDPRLLRDDGAPSAEGEEAWKRERAHAEARARARRAALEQWPTPDLPEQLRGEPSYKGWPFVEVPFPDVDTLISAGVPGLSFTIECDGRLCVPAPWAVLVLVRRAEYADAKAEHANLKAERYGAPELPAEAVPLDMSLAVAMLKDDTLAGAVAGMFELLKDSSRADVAWRELRAFVKQVRERLDEERRAAERSSYA